MVLKDPDRIQNGASCSLRMVSKRLTTEGRVSFWGSIVFILQQASSERADVCTNHRITLSGLAPDEAEKICLLAEILGWEARIARASACEAGDETGVGDGFSDGRCEERWSDAWAESWNERGRDAFKFRDGEGAAWIGVSPTLREPTSLREPLFPPATQTAPARLVLRQIGTVIRAETDDPGVRQQLARQGLDRMVSPVPLMALEQLLTLSA